MALDLSSILLGLALAGVPLLAFVWQLQRRASGHQSELNLLGERLNMAQLAQDGLSALDAADGSVLWRLEREGATYSELGYALDSGRGRSDWPGYYCFLRRQPQAPENRLY